ncbi:AAA family ATPase [Thiocystis violacea]|uniref:AAA family ATPase n=1 Tax=Thiocystis violacea TaxID=13725 RepID=UPI0019075E49|nr:AAA family ATPase [Thiocystis violacea]MBK1721947.1 hypothetical protein [Thiocystis violacea]
MSSPQGPGASAPAVNLDTPPPDVRAQMAFQAPADSFEPPAPDRAATCTGCGADFKPPHAAPDATLCHDCYEARKRALADLPHTANGKWLDILPALGVERERLRDEHGPCPGCGGTDRFRFDDKDGRGTWVCGGGGDRQTGDGFDLLSHALGLDKHDAYLAVAEHLGVIGSGPIIQPTPAEIAERQRQADERAARDAEDAARQQAETARKAAVICDESVAATENPYLTRKGVAATETLRQIETDTAAKILGYHPTANGKRLTGSLLVVPLHRNGELVSLELIDASGTKAALKGKGTKTGAYWAAQPLDAIEGTVIVGEGVSTALSIRMATGLPVVAALSVSNFAKTISAIHAGYKRLRPILAADLDKQTGEPIEAAVKASRQFRPHIPLVTPDFGPDRPEGATDFNDLHQALGLEAVREQIEAQWLNDRAASNDAASEAAQGVLPPIAELIATDEELENARLTPRCIVEDHTYADAAQIVAPGGTGKTTLLIHEAIRMALGMPLYGLTVTSPGWTFIVTAEDKRERLLARLREIINTMQLSPSERSTAIRSVRIWDVSGLSLKLVRAHDGNVILTKLADQIVEACKDDPPAVIIFDPLVSFGASEGMVNDNEQGLVTAARRIVNGLDCCVRLVHHTGKANGREKTLDQYSGRGGSALADGSRMTTVMQTWAPSDSGGLTPPYGCTPDKDSSISILARAKLSYAKPNLPLIWVKRTGWRFEHFVEAPRDKGEIRASKADQLERFLISELKNGMRHTKSTLEDLRADINMTRAELRGALATLQASHRVYDADLSDDEKQGRRKTYLHPAEYSADFSDDGGEIPPQDCPVSGTPDTPFNIAAALREKNGGDIAAPFFPQSPSHSAGGIGEYAAELAELADSDDREAF